MAFCQAEIGKQLITVFVLWALGGQKDIMTDNSRVRISNSAIRTMVTHTGAWLYFGIGGIHTAPPIETYLGTSGILNTAYQCIGIGNGVSQSN